MLNPWGRPALVALALFSLQPSGAFAQISPTAWYTVVNRNSGKCVDARAAASANGTAVQQYACNGTTAQQWQFQATSGGYYRANSRLNTAQSWDVANVSTADGGLIQLWAYGGGNNQQWLPVLETTGVYHFTSRNSGRCLDVPSASTADSVQLQQWACNNTAAQSFSLVAVGGTATPTATATRTATPTSGITATPTATATATATGVAPPPDFGPNVHIYSPSTPNLQTLINDIYNAQQPNHFGTRRDAILFLPGTYSGLHVPVGFYTQVLGLGSNPDQVLIDGEVRSNAFLSGDNATQNFWRGVENLSTIPSLGIGNNTMQWAVSQAIPFRRNHVRGNIKLNQNNGWSSGGWFADVLVDGNVNSGTQQQWVSRNTQWGSWSGSSWNMVFVGVPNPPAGDFPTAGARYTKIAQTPVIREKPYLFVDANGGYAVRLPSLRTNSSGITWANGALTPGTTIPISAFFIARPSDSAATINAQLAAGKHLLFTPGVYVLNQTLQVNNPNTVVLGLGFPTLRVDNGQAIMRTADVDGLTISGLFFDAGSTNSPVLLEIGPNGSSASHAANPTVLHDDFFRVGGAGAGSTSVNLSLNSNNVIVDHTWIWRADHGSGVGWTTNPSANGLWVNGNNVTIYGLFVEHYQNYQVTWNGNGGRVYFYQSEIPYDPPSQASWNSPTGRGYASYKVADTVTSHEAWGLGIYSVFTNPNIFLDRAIEVPSNANVRFHDMITVCLGGNGGIVHVINNTGAQTGCNASVTPTVTSFP